MRLLLAGDTHCSPSAIKDSFEQAVRLKCDKIFQLGDLGFWPRDRFGMKFLELIDVLVQRTGIPFYFLAGNHEDWDNLDIVFATYLKDEDGFHKYENLRLAPRSNIWTWDNMRFANMSGAFSIDRKFRTKGLDWFEQEMPTYEDVDRIRELLKMQGQKHIDVILAHDAPVNVKQHSGRGVGFENALAEFTQNVHAYAVQVFKPSIYLHGHWHMAYQYYFDHTFCVAVDQMTTSTTTMNLCVLDTTERTLAAVYSTESIIFEIP